MLVVVVVVVVVVCVRAARGAVECGLGEPNTRRGAAGCRRCSFSAAAASRAEGRRRRYSHCTDDGG